MKPITAILIFTLLSISVYAQLKEPQVSTLSISYFAPFAVQPGGRLGLDILLNNWRKEPDVKASIWVIRPHIGYFVRPDLHRNLIIGSELGYKLQKPNKRAYWLPTIEMSYLLSSENVEGSVHLGSGDITQLKETYHYFLPALGITYGIEAKKRIGYFFKLFYGRKISKQLPDAAVFGTEVGIKFLFQSINNQ